MKHGFSLTSPLYHVIITNRVNNGKHTKLPEGTTILDYLEQNHYVLAQIAVEHNYVILDKEDYAKVVLKDDDILEIVSFMGGGC